MDFYYNEVLEELYNDFYHTFKTYDLFKESVFKERDSRFKYKTMIEDINNYLSFEKSDNSNSSKRILDITSRPDKKPNQIKSTDQSVIKRKIKKSEEKQEDIEIPKTDVCFPMGFDRHEFSRVQLTKSDIKPVDAIYKLILPQRHLGHWEAL